MGKRSIVGFDHLICLYVSDEVIENKQTVWNYLDVCIDWRKM